MSPKIQRAAKWKPAMSNLGFEAFDADNHYYEAEDAFTRHIDRKMAKRAIQWIEIKGRRRILVGGKLDRFIPNPTFDPVARPGSLDQYFRGKNPDGKSMVELFGDLEPLSPAFQDRHARLELMDQQGLGACLLFPTLGVGIEQPLRGDADATCAALHAFNQWLDEDWGFHYENRLYAAPMISLMDLEQACAELEWCLERDARVVLLRAAPVPGDSHSRSPGDPLYDPFWARVSEAGITVAFHAGDSGYGRYAAAWEPRGSMEAFRGYAFGSVTQAGRATYDVMAALIIHGVFTRHPNVRVCSIENGAEWVEPLLSKLEKCHGQMPMVFKEPPIETFGRHVFVAPYYEDDVRKLADAIGVQQVLMGSDFPHAEGLADPIRFVDELEGFDEAEIRAIMHGNTKALVTAGWKAADAG